MKKIYLIQYNASDTSTLEVRIKALGTWVKYFSDNWIVESALSAKEIYEKLKVGYEDKNIFIIQLNTADYYGRMNTSVWDYLKSKKKNA